MPNTIKIIINNALTHTHTHMSSHFSFVLFNLLSTYSSRACIMDEGVKYAGDSGKKHMRN